MYKMKVEPTATNWAVPEVVKVIKAERDGYPDRPRQHQISLHRNTARWMRPASARHLPQGQDARNETGPQATGRGAMTAPSIETRDLTIRFGGHAAVNGVSCAFRPGELTVIVGPNGAGKTTCFNLISGQLYAQRGPHFQERRGHHRPVARRPAPRPASAAPSSSPICFRGLSVLENVRLAVQSHRGLGARAIRPAKSYRAIAERAYEHLETTRLADVADLPAAALPHGDQRKLEVALLLAMEPDIFMFDEPTAGMSVDEAPVILDLIAEIKKDTDKTILLVEHKMEVVRALADRIVVLHNGELVADGAPDTVMALPIVREIYLGLPPEEEATREADA